MAGMSHPPTEYFHPWIGPCNPPVISNMMNLTDFIIAIFLFKSGKSHLLDIMSLT